MRRLWAAGAAMVVCVALGAVPVVGQEAAESEAPAGPMTIGFAGFGSDYWFLDDITQGAQQAADAAGVTLVVSDAGWAGLSQASQVEDLVTQGVDAIIVATPWDPEPVLPAIEAATAAGIPVLSVDRAIAGATSYIGTDNVAGSRMAGEYLFEAMGGSGTVVEIEGDPSWAQGRTDGFAQALEAAPGITLVGQETARDDPNSARLLIADFLGANPEVTGIFVHTDAMTPGALQAVAEAGLTDTVKVVSFDGAPEMLPAVKDGTLAGTVAQRPDLMGQQAVEAAILAAAGETLEAFIPVETTLVTADNVDQFLTGEADGSTVAPMGPVIVHSTLNCTVTTDFTGTTEGDVQNLRAATLTCDMTADDARLTGPVTVQIDCDCTGAGCSCWGTSDGPQNEGGWEGFLVSAEPNGVAPATVWVAEGTGAYEGWTWVETHQPTGDMVYEGTAMVYPGAPPLWAPLPSNE